MKAIKTLLLTIAMGMPAMASATLTCYNPATGAALKISPAYARASAIRDHLQMNQVLVQALFGNIPYYQRSGIVDSNIPSAYYFVETDPVDQRILQVMSVAGGIKVLVSHYADNTKSEFYFNPGECQISN
ncbi:MAG: hypothetical protein ACXVCY_08835 [Pseudobdellovibrionaceae bacterium]